MELQNFKKYVKTQEKKKNKLKLDGTFEDKDIAKIEYEKIIALVIIYGVVGFLMFYLIAQIINMKRLVFIEHIIGIGALIISAMTVYKLGFQMYHVNMSSYEIYQYYNYNKNILNKELFEALEFPDVRLNPENTEIYFDDKNITNEVLACDTVEKQIKYIQNLRVQI